MKMYLREKALRLIRERGEKAGVAYDYGYFILQSSDTGETERLYLDKNWDYLKNPAVEINKMVEIECNLTRSKEGKAYINTYSYKVLQ